MKIKNYFKVLPLVLMMFTSCDKKEEEINLTPEIENQVFEVSESVSSGEKFADIVATDAEENKLVFKIKENEADLFEVSEEGALSIAATKSLDYETKTIHKITVEVSDGSTKASAEVTIKVTDVDETPVIANQQFTVVENVLATHIIGSVVATDPNNDPLTYSVTSTDFEINNSGELSLIDGKTLDYETKNEYKITVQVSDGALTASAEITINITNENEVPVIENQTFAVAEDILATQIIGKVAASDPDVGARAIELTIKEDSDNLFKIYGNGDLYLKEGKELDYETKTTHKIIVQVSDGSLTASAEITINVTDVDETAIVTIPDANFKRALLANTRVNLNGDSEIQVVEANGYEGHLVLSSSRISVLTGIEYFTKMTGLSLNNNGLGNFDLSKNINLKSLNLSSCALSDAHKLDLSKNVLLEELFLSYNNLSSIDLSKNIKLKILTIERNKLTHIDLSQNTKLETLDVRVNRLATINTSNNRSLRVLKCRSNKIASLDLSKNTELTSLIVFQNLLTQLDVSNNLKLTNLDCGLNGLTSLDLSNNTILEVLLSTNSELSNVILPNSSNLKGVNLQYNKITTLDVSKNANLRVFKLDNNQLTSVNLTNNTELIVVSLKNNNKLIAVNMANGNNHKINDFDATNCSSLTCIQIDSGFIIPTAKWQKDSTASYSYTTCP